MKDLLESFTQAPDGSWTCTRSGRYSFSIRELKIDSGARFARGQLVNGFDIASFLDLRCAFANGD